jgi:hypothetical protein
MPLPLTSPERTASESPATVHGRVLEAVHLTGYTFSRALDELKWLLTDGRWKETGHTDVNAFIESLGFGAFVQNVEQRRDIAKLYAEAGASQRATARALAVDDKTIRNDLAADKVRTPSPPSERIQRATSTAAEKLRTGQAWSLSSVDPAKAVQQAATKAAAAEDTRARRERSQTAPARPDGCTLRIGDCREVLADIEDDSVSLILTDPPYGDAAEPLWHWLGAWAARVLIPGGSLVCFDGQSNCLRHAGILHEHLRYWWLLSLRHHHAQRIPGKFVIAEHKPVWWFVKGHRRGRTLVTDVLRPDRRDKAGHEWGQGDGGVELLIEQLTEADERIVDPFAGTAQWGEIAARMGRVWIGADVVEGGAATAVTEVARDYMVAVTSPKEPS